MTNTFMTREELDAIGFKSIGNDALISKNACIHGAGNIELGNHVRIDDFCFLSGRIKLGNYVHLTAGVYLYGSLAGIEFEDYTTAAPRTTIHADTDDYSGVAMTNPLVPAQYTNVKHAPVLVREHTIIGSGCVILPGVTLETGTAIGAMSLVAESTEPWTINCGIPCKVLKQRSKDLLLLHSQWQQEQLELRAEL